MFYVYFKQDGKEIVQQFRTELAAQLAVEKAKKDGHHAEMRSGNK